MSALRHSREAFEGVVDGVADEETHVGGDLLVAAAAGVELEGEGADLFGEFELDEVVDVFGLRVGGDDGCASFGLCLATSVGRALRHRAEEFVAGEDAGGLRWRGRGLAGFDLVGEEAPVEGEGALPVFEGGVEWFAEAAGPHFVRVVAVRTLSLL